MRNYERGARVICATLILAACNNEPSAPPAALPPAIVATQVIANPDNVLSAVLGVHVTGADSVAVRFHSDAAPLADSATPAVLVVGDSATIPVLGLFPVTSYALRVVAYGPGGSITGDSLTFTTGPLPSDLPSYNAGGSDPSPGYVVFAAKSYGVVIDNTGRVVWYRHFATPPGLSFMAEPNGHYATRPSTADPTDIEPWLEIDPVGKVTRELRCGNGLQSRPHDLIIQPDDSYWIMCDEVRTEDLTGVGGVANAQVTGTDIQHVSSAGKVLFSWSPFDHFAITDGPVSDRTGAAVNWTHGNAIDVDADGNIIASFRNLSEITKIDGISGDIIWRLGGLRNQFSFLDVESPMFAGQHSVRLTDSHDIVVLDNLGANGESRGERYYLNPAAFTAQLGQTYIASPPVVTQIGGSVQDLPHGRTLVSFGTTGHVEEYDQLGQVVWSITGNAGYVFRAERIRSLYAPGVGSAR